MMHKQIYINLAVQDLPRSINFFTRLGYDFDTRFSNEQGACLILGDNLYVMLLTQNFFASFIDKPLCDPAQQTEVLVCLSCESREEVDELVRKARTAGATVPRAPQDYGFMYGHGFQDLDGHVWELSYMAPCEAHAAA